MIKLFADFNNADSLGRVRLNSQGSLEDIKRKAIQLHDGLTVQLYSDDDVDVLGNPHELTVAGVLSYSTEEKCWVAAIDWNKIQCIRKLFPEMIMEAPERLL